MPEAFHPRYQTNVDALIDRHTQQLANGFKVKGKLRAFHRDAVQAFRHALEEHVAGLQDTIQTHSKVEAQRVKDGQAEEPREELIPLLLVHGRIMNTHGAYVIQANKT